jgi:hypothetical protein
MCNKTKVWHEHDTLIIAGRTRKHANDVTSPIVQRYVSSILEHGMRVSAAHMFSSCLTVHSNANGCRLGHYWAGRKTLNIKNGMDISVQFIRILFLCQNRSRFGIYSKKGMGSYVTKLADFLVLNRKVQHCQDERPPFDMTMNQLYLLPILTTKNRS